MTMTKISLAMAFILLVWPLAAQPVEGSMRFSTHDPCGGGNADFCAPVIVGRGVIDGTTVAKFKLALNEHMRASKIEPPGTGISAVILSSPGGSLAAGLALGMEIRRRKIDTRAVSNFDEYVRSSGGEYSEKPLLRNAKCLSACAYAFLGGSKRLVEDDNVLGIHQFRSQTSTETSESDTQITTARLSLYVEGMGVSPKFTTIASLTRPDEISYLGTGIARSLNVDNVKMALADWTIAATSNGTPVLVVDQGIDQRHSVKIAMILDGQRLLVQTTTVVNVNETRPDRLAVFPDNEKPLISFLIDDRAYRGVPLSSWKKTTAPGVLMYAAVSAFPQSMLTAIQRAKSLSISDDFGHATEDLSMTTNLSLVGLASGIALLLRTR